MSDVNPSGESGTPKNPAGSGSLTPEALEQILAAREAKLIERFTTETNKIVHGAIARDVKPKLQELKSDEKVSSKEALENAQLKRWQQMEQQYTKDKVEFALQKALGKFEVLDSSELVEILSSKFRFEDGKVFTIKDDVAVSPDEYVQEYLKARPHHLKPKSMSGTATGEAGTPSRPATKSSELTAQQLKEAGLDLAKARALGLIR